jgi:trans-2,3-dihydro-3-hydroxyanthranilate isomerase
MRFAYYHLDVFTERKLAGNPLAVVLEADRLKDDEMLAITREFNLSETVFVMAPADPANTAAVRIFTPGGELPFAGHPTVGTGVLLAMLHASDHMQGQGVTIALEERIGLVKVEVSQRKGRAARGVFALPKLPERLALTLDAEAVATALGLPVEAIGFDAHELSAWSAGVPFVMVPLKNRELAMQASVADMAAWRRAFGGTGKGAAYLYTRDTVSPEHQVHARMFSPVMGIGEDPATGSAAAAFAGAAVAFERPEDGLHQIIIEQGYEMGRPSQIVLDLDIEGGVLTGARVGGAAVVVATGTIEP